MREMTEAQRETKLLKDDSSRDRARHIRDYQWRLMERMQEHDPLWICYWNKARLEPEANEERMDLIGAMEVMEWFHRRHRDWVEIGKEANPRQAFPCRLTEAGRQALANRQLYDMEHVEGGMVEPGWKAFPFPAGRAALKERGE